MAKKKEIAEVKAFLKANRGKWVSCKKMEKACPSLLHYRDDESEPLLYAINSVCRVANIEGGIEEHGYGDFLVVYDEAD